MASKKIVITNIRLKEHDLLLCGLMEDDRLIEAHLDRLPSDGDPSASSVNEHILGNIYIGKVQRVVTNLNAAFVEIAPNIPCYLSLKNVNDPVFLKSTSPGRIVQGDEILVQIRRDASRGKAPTLSTNLNFSGRYAVLTTQNQYLSVSAKLDQTAKDHYRKLLANALPEGCGLIVRTNAQYVEDEDILSEINELKQQMDHVVQYAANHTCFSCLYRPPAMYLTCLQGVYAEGLDEIVTDVPSVYEELLRYREKYRDLAAIPLKLYEDECFSLVSLYNLNREMMRATAREVRLKSGGFLVIDPTEAMTVIDVNTGKSASHKEREEHFYQVNREASREIGRQLRLRNLSGIIVIDYIDLHSEEKKEALLRDLAAVVKADPVPVIVHDITALNLVEVTRKKVEKSLSEQIKLLTMPNPLC